MTETTQDAFVKGYNQGRADAETFRQDHPTTVEDSMFKTPDITPAQVVALVGAALGAAAAFGFDVSSDQRDSIMQLVTVLASVLLVGDAAIRHGRATGSAKKDG